MFVWLNLGSLVLGLIAWVLPLITLVADKKENTPHRGMLSIISFSACGVSLCFQILYIYHKVTVEDWSALLDTMYAVASASVLLLAVTILLNLLSFIVQRRAGSKVLD
ncbi:hypothetical protein ACKA06_15880 [Rossellomorea oryzaecorticis]|uniref:Cytochrome c oxidase subunit 4 n=1 Tax=Rossellomorea oryzaecorticis TaxID=1396505 RepID=A0ABW8VSB7_9BACI